MVKNKDAAQLSAARQRGEKIARAGAKSFRIHHTTGPRVTQPFLIQILARSLHLADRNPDRIKRAKFARVADSLRRQIIAGAAQ